MTSRFLPIGMLFTLALCFWLQGCAQNTPEAVFNRGYRALEEGDVIGASLYFEEFLNKFPEDESTLKAYELLANCHLMLKDFGNARAVFEEVREKYAAKPEVVLSCDFQIGRTYFEQGNFPKAQAKFTEIASATTNPLIRFDAHRGLAAAFAKQTQTDEAVSEYQTMLGIAQNEIVDPTDAFSKILESLTAEADVLMASQEFDKARDVYQKTIDVISDITGVVGVNYEKQFARFRWAHTWVKAGDLISAATTYDKLLDDPLLIADWVPQVINWKIQTLERLLREDGDADYSPEEIAALVRENKRLSEEFPTNQFGTEAMMKIALLVKDSTPELSAEYTQKAVDVYEKQIAEPSSPQAPMNAMFSMADMYIRLGKTDEAKQALERVKKSYSNIPKAVQQADQMLYYIEQQAQAKLQAPAATPGAAQENASSAPKEE